jgi:hypothetical protein
VPNSPAPGCNVAIRRLWGFRPEQARLTAGLRNALPCVSTPGVKIAPLLASKETIRRLRGFRREQARSAAGARNALPCVSTTDVKIAPLLAKNTSLPEETG